MQTTQFLIVGMAALTLASPINEQSGTDSLVDRAASAEPGEIAGFSEKRNEDPHQLFRRNKKCTIVNTSDTVNCRSCASTDCGVVTTFKAGSTHSFKCGVKGQCVTIDGVTNCSWDKADRTLAKDCWVNGYYTDYQCTLAALGTDC